MTQPFFQKAISYIVPALKVVGCAGVALAAGFLGGDDVAKDLIDGVDEETVTLMKSGLDLVKSLGGGAVPGTAKDLFDQYRLTVNGDFEKAFHKAIADSLTAIEQAYNGEHTEADNQQAAIALFFAELKRVLDTTPVSEADVERYVIDRQHFLHHVKGLDSLAGLDDTLPENLLLFIQENFSITLQHELLKQLKSNANAQTAYVVTLLELNLQYGAKNAETLDALNQKLWELTNTVEAMQTQGNRIVHLLLLIQDELRKLNIDVRKDTQKILDELRKNRKHPRLTDYTAYQKRSTDKAYRYDYKAAYTTFIGRENELAHLERFVLPNPQAKFRWWLVTGPGGIGKSRLAQKLCTTFINVGEYDAGFFEGEEKGKRNPFDWDNWQPTCNTLIVLDYVSTRADEVRAIIDTLADRADELDYSVRLLLLERNTNGPWWQTINTHGASLNAYADPMAVSAFSDDDRWRIIDEVHRKVTDEHRQKGEEMPKPLPDRNETLAKLKQLDEFDRPLFAFFVGMALSDGKDIRDWGVHELLTHILNEHERIRWWGKSQAISADQQQAYERLLALATIMRGLTLAQWRTINKDINGLPGTDSYDLSLLNRLGGFTKENKTLKNLEPDILGEFFTSRVLNDWQGLYDNGTNVPTLIGHAWQMAPEPTWAFSERLLLDFPQTECLPLFWDDLPRNERTKAESAIAWSSFQMNLTNSLWMSRRPDLADAVSRYKAIVKLREQLDFAVNVELALEQAKAATNLTSYFGRSKQFDKIIEYYTAIVELRQEQPDFAVNVELALRQAKAAYNLVTALGQEKYYTAIVELRQEQPDFAVNVELALEQAAAAANLTAALGQEKYYTAIVELRQEQPDFAVNVELALEQAKAAANLIAILSDSEERFIEAIGYYGQVVATVVEFNEAPLLLPIWAWATRVLLMSMLTWAQRGWFTPAETMTMLFDYAYGLLKDLYNTVDHPAARVEFGKAIDSLLRQPGAGNYPPELVAYWASVIRTLLEKDSNHQDAHWQSLLPGFSRWIAAKDAESTEDTEEA